jgi:hypothetical protein
MALPRVSVYFIAMERKGVSRNKKKARALPRVPAAPPKRTAVSGGPSGEEVPEKAFSIHFAHGASGAVSIKLIPERSTATTQLLLEIHDRPYDAYPHSGLNE